MREGMGAQNGGMGRSIMLEGACEEATEDRGRNVVMWMDLEPVTQSE